MVYNILKKPIIASKHNPMTSPHWSSSWYEQTVTHQAWSFNQQGIPLLSRQYEHWHKVNSCDWSSYDESDSKMDEAKENIMSGSILNDWYILNQ